VGTTEQRRGTYWICGCENLFKYRAPSERRPDRLRIRAGLCGRCKRKVLKMAETQLERLVSKIGDVRILDQWN